MADYYQSWSATVDCPTKELADELAAALQTGYHWNDDAAEEGMLCCETIEVEEDNRNGAWYVLVSESGQGGDLASLMDTVASWQRKNKIMEPFAVEWANTCSKMRTDGFGGGAVLAYRGCVRWQSTSDWVFKQVERIKKGQAK